MIWFFYFNINKMISDDVNMVLWLWCHAHCSNPI